MSFFGKLFGKGADKDPVTTGEAIQKLRETEDMLMKKQVTGTLFDNFLLTNICRISWKRKSRLRFLQPGKMPRQIKELLCRP